MVLCDNLVNSLKLLANQLKNGDSPIESIVTRFHDKSRKDIIDRSRNFIEVCRRLASRHRVVQGKETSVSAAVLVIFQRRLLVMVPTN